MVFPARRFNCHKPWFLYVPGSDSVASLERKMKRLVHAYYYHERGDTRTLIRKYRLWRASTEDMS